MMRHDLIRTGDADVFPAIADRNGEVVLDYCRRCREGEGSLARGGCPGASRDQQIQRVYEAAMAWRSALASAVRAGIKASERERANDTLLQRLDDLERACDAAKVSL